MQYYKWLELNILHQYLSDGNVPISLVPTQVTSVILERNNILLRQAVGVFEFYIGSDSVDIDIASKLENLADLKFELIINDPLFFNYTDLSFFNSEEYFLFRNISNSSNIQIEKASSVELEEQLKEKSIGILQIDTNNIQNKSLTLLFPVRNVFWQYTIVIPESRNIKIIDLKIFGFNNEKYAGPVDEIIIGGQPALVFTSTATLPLMQRLTVNPILKLIYKSPHSTREELELTLPIPSADKLAEAQEGINDGLFVSNTIVYI